MKQPNHLLTLKELLSSVDDRIWYFERTSPDDLVLTPEERILVELRDEEHKGSWDVMMANLVTHIGRLPIHSGLNSEADIRLIRDALQPYEIKYRINLADLTRTS